MDNLWISRYDNVVMRDLYDNVVIASRALGRLIIFILSLLWRYAPTYNFHTFRTLAPKARPCLKFKKILNENDSHSRLGWLGLGVTFAESVKIYK